MAIFTVLALIDAGQAYAMQHFEDVSISWSLAVRRGLECNYLMAVFGLGVLWLANRLPLDRGRTTRWVLMHLALSLVFAQCYNLAYAAVLDGQMSVRGTPFEFQETFKKLAIHYTLGHVGIYWIILLAHHGWRYYRRYRERELRAAELEGQLSRARLDVLRMQLNPHFLFNTLNTIAALIHEQPDAADRTLTRLGELLRQSLDQSTPYEVPLRQELAFLERYLDIERARFGDRLTVDFDVPESVREALVPSLILQPIVENAIRHGIEPRAQAGHIVIQAERQDAQLNLTIADNGSGIETNAPSLTSEGIGLSNTRSRLRQLYGESQNLRLTNLSTGGLEVRITLPCRTAKDPLPTPCHPSAVAGYRPAPSPA